MKKSTLQETKQPSEMTVSPGLAFITTAIASMPNSIGDRLFAGTMNELLSIAIKCNMRFDRSDGNALSGQSMCHESSVGVFRPLEQRWYELACMWRSTPYALMWENHMGFKPWRADTAYAGQVHLALPVRSRVAPGLAVLLPSQIAEPTDVLKHKNQQVWWCTSISIDRAYDTITLCRYRPGRYGGAFSREGAPASRRHYSRDDWERDFANSNSIHEKAAS